jgi:hypothetical protein
LTGPRPADALAGKQAGNLREIGRNVIDLALEGRPAHGPADKEQLEGEPLEKRLVVNKIRQGIGEHLIEHDVLQVLVGDHGLDQMLGFSAACSDKHAAAAFEFGNCFLGANGFGSIKCLPVHSFLCLSFAG